AWCLGVWSALGVTVLLQFGGLLFEFVGALRIAQAAVQEAEGFLHILDLRQLRGRRASCTGRVMSAARQLGIRRLRVLGRLQPAHLVSQSILGVREGAQARPYLGDALCSQPLLDLSLRLVGLLPDLGELGAIRARRQAAAPSARRHN